MLTWCALVPQKSFAAAKGRIRLPAEQRRAVATAMLRDTVAAVAETAGVAEVLVLWDADEDRRALPGVGSVSVRGLGLNASLDRGATVARTRHPGRGVVVVPGDLPALDPVELAGCLARASRFSRAYLHDMRSTGTTILTATGDFPLLPAYGEGSATGHAATGAYPLGVTDSDTLRVDVDDLDSLADALALGCGHHTLETCASLGLALEVLR
jgi:2-phospho-L-lactate guanylyltransferase